ncbi:hypothetical protein JCM19037_4647 [Geomicrobium sp. JCM 19037]|uniref:hypothetical protein n=1 Tax=Geomicrobium sp. JCM 19037 TaxID=1460634 RepID=UPI00045F40F1|nr:hypothetical protein [Geomicrobium sp. JCM 19037]GAK06086.1 hypothetical protein JCM19037_4647 [Geomicrobium sp. JCM 19037]
MNILIDESLGIRLPTEYKSYDFQWNEKDFPIRKSGHSLKTIASDQKNKRLSTSVQYRLYTTEAEVEHMTSKVDVEVPLYYFYDPQTTDDQKLQRIKQWLIPHYRLHYIKSSPYQAKTLSQIEQLVRLSSTDDGELTRSEERLLILTPKVKPFIKTKKRFKMFPTKEYKTFKLIEKTSDKWEIHDVGKWETLFARMMKFSELSKHEGWMTYAGLHPFKEDAPPDNLTVVESSDTMLPGNLPHIQLYLPISILRLNKGEGRTS